MHAPTALGQVAITVRDVAASVAFYRDVLGLPLLFQAPPNLAFFQAGATRIMLAQPEGNGAEQSHPTLYYTVPDIDAMHTALGMRGANLVDAPHIVAKLGEKNLWMFFVRDPDQHLVGLMCEK